MISPIDLAACRAGDATVGPTVDEALQRAGFGFLLAAQPTWTFDSNRYPPMIEVGESAPGQFRIGAHTGLGTVTVLDRADLAPVVSAPLLRERLDAVSVG
jgi:hypothetical protein